MGALVAKRRIAYCLALSRETTSQHTSLDFCFTGRLHALFTSSPSSFRVRASSSANSAPNASILPNPASPSSDPSPYLQPLLPLHMPLIPSQPGFSFDPEGYPNRERGCGVQIQYADTSVDWCEIATESEGLKVPQSIKIRSTRL